MVIISGSRPMGKFYEHRNEFLGFVNAEGCFTD
jgi:hypothetical protein